MIRALLGSRFVRGGLILTGLAAVVAAPLAVVGATPAGAVTIAGAQTLSDTVAVDWNHGHRQHTTDLHVLSWNDFHGNLEPAGLNIYGRFAGGAAYLAKLVKDRQAQYGHHQAIVLAGDNIGASPLADGLFFGEPATIVTNLMNHQGGVQVGPDSALNGCAGNLAGSEIEKIVQRLDPSIKMIISGHTHAEYRCTITTGGVTLLITSAASFGRILSDLTLTVDDRTGELVAASATNSIVENALNTPGPGVIRQDDPSKADPRVAAVVKQYVDAAAPLANKVIGKIQGDLTRAPSPFGETTLGDVIADAQLKATADAATGGAQVAFMNPGGIRADLRTTDISSGGEAIGEVTYGEAFSVQPFGNSLVTKTMTGDQIRRLLQQQFVGCGQTSQRVLQISATMTYQSNPAAATCADKIGEIRIGGVVVTATTTLRVTMNNFLAFGGDGFTVFTEGTNALGGAQDIDALVDYFAAAGATGVAVPPLNRITAKP